MSVSVGIGNSYFNPYQTQLVLRGTYHLGDTVIVIAYSSQSQELYEISNNLYIEHVYVLRKTSREGYLNKYV